ncbi:DUF2937 family protein [Marivibrio halodurans]|uniref:DUF2937 family protein n=1 Tax=Marivibrio halodurans TaxID=2039722 RepID=A0A8J7V474_9PROT|nr:DUF2937 family protein [Marivibrio halodurans]MBP5859061.1 DUF2937 family protein [Marivibrio halodurans]
MARPLLIAFAVLLAALASQFPAFRDAYLQRIGGALDEVTRQVAALDERAAAAGLERYAYVRRLSGNPDPVVAREGRALIDLLGRQHRLSAARDAVRDAPVYVQAAQVLLHLEPDIADAALADFQPAVPLSLSAVFHAFIGFVVGLFLPMGVRRLFPRRVAEGA